MTVPQLETLSLGLPGLSGRQQALFCSARPFVDCFLLTVLCSIAAVLLGGFTDYFSKLFCISFYGCELLLFVPHSSLCRFKKNKIACIGGRLI